MQKHVAHETGTRLHSMLSVLQAADAQQWLKAACRQATEGPMASTAADFACAREQAFPPAEENAFRHLRTSDFSDNVAALPPEELQVLLALTLIARSTLTARLA